MKFNNINNKDYHSVDVVFQDNGDVKFKFYKHGDVPETIVTINPYTWSYAQMMFEGWVKNK